MSDILQVEPREALGKRNSRRMRTKGLMPAVLYGHGKEPLSLTVSASELRASLRHGAKIVELKGAATGQALLQDIQWDTFEQHLLHVDLLRVDAQEKVQVEVPLVIRGEAPGQSEGGLVEQAVHSVEIETTAASIPEHLHLNINELHLGGTLTVGDIEGLPEGAKVLLDDDAVLVSCHEPKAVAEEEEGAELGAIEPEVIGAKSDEEEEAAGG